MVAITFPNEVFGFSGLIHACVSLMDFQYMRQFFKLGK